MLRKLCALVVLVIGYLYLVPQFTAAGQVLTLVSGVPYWVGVVVAGVVVSVTLALGGMRAATYVQAFQFALKLVLFAVPALWLLLAVGPEVRHQAVHPVEFTRFTTATTVDFTVDTRFELTEPVTVRDRRRTARAAGAGTAHRRGRRAVGVPGGRGGTADRRRRRPGQRDLAAPAASTPGSAGHALLGTWSVLMATALGTMGLPHVLVRFHTSPDGRSARRTAAITVALLGAFYLFPAVYGLLGAVLLPQLYLSGATDTVVVALPSRVDPGWPGDLFTALLTAGAFAAFLATSLGMLLAVSGAVSHDLIPAGLRRLRLTPLAAAAVVVLLALPGARVDVGALVTSAFAVAASTFCPLLVLGIWWRRLTARGALVGMAVGLVSSAGVMAAGLVAGLEPGVPALLLAQPALWSVPLAFVTMIVVSLRGSPPSGAASAMLRLHLDETASTPLAVLTVLTSPGRHGALRLRRCGCGTQGSHRRRVARLRGDVTAR